jgi:hypothetical protein
MKPRLLIRLETDIGGSLHSVAADCLRCERAAYVACLGDFEAAVDEVAAVQRRHASQPNAAISAWSSFAEAIVSHHGDLETAAVDKMKRSHALSKAVRLRPLHALSAAWLAHFSYLRMDIASMARLVAEALQTAHPDHHVSRARANLVVAEAYDEGGRLDLARPWYANARYHAAQDGDDATLSSVMWTMGSLRVAALQQAADNGPTDTTAGDHALLSVESAARFDELLGMRSRRSLHLVLRAQLCMLLGRSDEALALYDDAQRAAVACQGTNAASGLLLADRAWCRFNAGREADARRDAEAAALALASEVSAGRRLASHRRLVQLYSALGEAPRAQRHHVLQAGARESRRAEQSDLVDAMNREFAMTAA